MNIAVLQHAEFEGPGMIGVWASTYNHRIKVHHLYRGDPLPAPDDFDLLVVMGGEMNIYQYREWPWLKSESAFIKYALGDGKKVVGICLGAQLIADALGARVVQNGQVELGWLSVTCTKEAQAAFPELPAFSTVLHWHGDTFGLPPGATRLAFSEACPEQGFLIKDQCLGLQFHMEVDPELVTKFIESQTDWPTGPSVQTPGAIADNAMTYFDQYWSVLFTLLDRFCSDDWTPSYRSYGMTRQIPRR
jgi:GMP synthase-like glutamine amidotransferase